MKAHQFVICALLSSVLCSCEGVAIVSPPSGPSGPLVLQNTTTPSISSYTAAAFPVQPVFGVYQSGSPDSSLSDSIELRAYLDSNCSTTPANGTLSATENPLALNSGVARFSGLSYSVPGHLEETIYLSASTLQSGLSICISGVAILQHFNEGVGYVVSGTTGASGSTGSAEFDGPNSLQIDSEGRLVVLDQTLNPAGHYQFAIWRYFPDGTLDTSLGSGAGYVLSPSTGAAGGSGSTLEDYGEALQIDSQGRYVVGGFSMKSVGGYEAAVWRYNSNGTLDTTLNGTGYAVSGTTGAAGATGAAEADYANNLQIDSQGRYVLAGNSRNTTGGYEAAFWRFNSTGTLDSTFGGAGYVVSGATGAAGATGSSEYDAANSFQIDSQGRIVAAGSSKSAAGGTELAIWRFNSNGTADTSFGGGSGHVVSGATGAAGATGSSEYDYATSLQLDSQGRLVMAGASANASGGTELAIWRYTSAGSLDSSFGTGGDVVSGATGAAGATGSSEYDVPEILRIDSQGRLVMAGFSAKSGGGYEAVVWRNDANGSPDTTFGAGAGYVLSGTTGAAGDTGSSEFDLAGPFQIDRQGRIVVAGDSKNTAGGTEMAIWRFLSDGALDQ